MEIRPFGTNDIPMAIELSDAAGWNQLAMDWQRIIDVEPEGCLGAWIDARLVGTTTFVTYGDRLAWIGMVLVHPEQRRQGIGRRLFQEIMSELDRRGTEDIGLDATDLGRALYLDEGFVDVERIVRWHGVLQPSSVANGSIRTAREADVGAIAAFDREITGIDRSALLEHLMAEEGVSCLVSDHVDAYAFVRPGRLAWQIGPLVAPSREAADALISVAADQLNGREVIVDSPWKDAAALLGPWGMAPRRRLMRMTYRRVSRLLTDEHVPAATSFAWG